MSRLSILSPEFQKRAAHILDGKTIEETFPSGTISYLDWNSEPRENEKFPTSVPGVPVLGNESHAKTIIVCLSGSYEVPSATTTSFWARLMPPNHTNNYALNIAYPANAPANPLMTNTSYDEWTQFDTLFGTSNHQFIAGYLRAHTLASEDDTGGRITAGICDNIVTSFPQQDAVPNYSTDAQLMASLIEFKENMPLKKGCLAHIPPTYENFHANGWQAPPATWATASSYNNNFPLIRVSGMEANVMLEYELMFWVQVNPQSTCLNTTAVELDPHFDKAIALLCDKVVCPWVSEANSFFSVVGKVLKNPLVQQFGKAALNIVGNQLGFGGGGGQPSYGYGNSSFGAGGGGYSSYGGYGGYGGYGNYGGFKSYY